MKIVPFTPSISSIQSFSVNLGELVCDFTLSWNVRSERWFCDFSTSSGHNLSVKLVESSSLLGIKNRTGLDGDFRVILVNSSCVEGITYDNFGTDWVLVYGTNEEWREFDGLLS